MEKAFISGFNVLAVILLLAAGCKKDAGPEKLPALNIIPKPAKGLTTDVFDITIEPATKVSTGQTLFYRWDWDNDGIWDTPFSTGNQLKHRFLQPGSRIIRVECSDGKKQVIAENLTIVVDQGFSAPRPLFTINPGAGNFLTNFTFDASLTKDDEDSLDQLKFRWDFKGDGNWATQFISSPTATYQFARAGHYTPKLEARDPSGRTAIFTGDLLVNMEDSLIIAAFTINKPLIRMGDTLLLDASGSYPSRDRRRDLLFSWYLPDRAEWTTPDTLRHRSAIVNQKGQMTVLLKVIDKETNLYNQHAESFIAGDQNLAPRAKIRVSQSYGNILTQFYFDAWSSLDDNQAPSELDVRWDFDGDGNWDTPFSKDKMVFHQYESPGDYNLALQVRDSEWLASLNRTVIHVTSNTNPTGYFKDQRDGNFYGTVKIGSQWWMSQNLNFTIPQKQVSGVLQWLCLFEQSKWCDQVGKLYRIGAVIESRADDEYTVICPNGWRIPSKEDWETLFGSVGGEANARELRYGGKADFNALDLGYGDYYFVWKGMMIVDTVYEFHQTYQKAWFLSTSEPYDPNHARLDVWQWGVGRDSSAWVGYGPTQLYMPVRCVKND